MILALRFLVLCGDVLCQGRDGANTDRGRALLKRRNEKPIDVGCKFLDQCMQHEW